MRQILPILILLALPACSKSEEEPGCAARSVNSARLTVEARKCVNRWSKKLASAAISSDKIPNVASTVLDICARHIDEHVGLNPTPIETWKEAKRTALYAIGTERGSHCQKQ
jgi:hypothetical protein